MMQDFPKDTEQRGGPQQLSFKISEIPIDTGSAFMRDGALQGCIYQSLVPLQSSTMTAPRRVSRFEDVFEKIRRRQAVPNPITPPISYGLNTHPQHEDIVVGAKLISPRVQRIPWSNTAVWSSITDPQHRTTFGARSTSPSSQASAVTAEASQNATRKQQLMQKPSWRRHEETPQSEFLASFSTTSSSAPEQMVSARAQAIEAAIRAKQAAIEKQTPGTLRAYRPSHRALAKAGIVPDRSSTSLHNNASPNSRRRAYQGNPTSGKNRSADIPEHENCALWICGLPSSVTYPSLLEAIRGVGKVYAVFINPPMEDRAIKTSAAKIVFFRRSQAEKIYKLIENGHFVVMNKFVYNVRWNEIKSGPYPFPNHSRAIRITGKENEMDFEFWEDFFVRRFEYDLDRREVVHCDRPGFVSHEWHFASLRCQAAAAKTAIEREYKGIFEVEWAADPCE